MVVRRENTRKAVKYSGRILEYIGGVLSLRLKTSGSIRRFESSEIVEIHTGQTESQTQGLKYFQSGQLAEAAVALEAATRQEVRDWVRRDALALLTRVRLRQGNRSAAADAFVRLTDSDPNTHHFGLIPLWWSDDLADAAAVARARVWLTSPNYSARLIGASILLSTPDARDEAVKALEAIAASGKPRFVQLARAQQWRARLREAKPVSDAEMNILRLRIGSIKPDERAGPRFLLGKAHSLRLENERAAMEYLWVPLVYPSDHWFAAEAMFRAASSLEKAGRLPEAESLYRETVQRFPATPFAKKADDRLKPRTSQPH